jgi:WD40 repeat protein
MKKFFLFLAIAAAMWQAAQAQDGDIVWTKWTHDITRLQFSNDDSKILTVGSGGIIIFNTTDGSQVKQLDGNGGYSDDGTIIYSSHLNDTEHYIEIFDANSYESIRRIELPEIVGKYGVTLSSDKKTFVAGGYNDLYFIDFETGVIKKHLTKFGSETRPVSLGAYPFTKDGKYVIVTLADPVKGQYGKMMFINTITYQADYESENYWNGGVALSNDGTLGAFGTLEGNKAVAIMNLQTKEIVGQILGKSSSVCGMAFSPSSDYLAVSWQDKLNIEIFNVINLNIEKTFKLIIDGNSCCFPPMSVSNDNKYIAGGGGPGLVLFKFSTSGVPEDEELLQILYPNPTSNSINLLFELIVPSNLKFNLYDLPGVLITNLKTGFYNPGIVEENFYLGELTNGTYFLKIESLQFNKTYKIIINR